MSFSDFSSWPRDQEASFVVYEQRIADAQKKAWMFGGIAAIVFFVFMVGIYAGVKPDIKDITKDMNMSNLTKKDSDKKAPKVEAPAPAPAPDPAPAAAPDPAPTPAPAQ